MLEKYLWDATRFGALPSKLKFRLFGSSTRPIVVVSLPKSGTHLIERALCLYPSIYRTLNKTIIPENTSKNRFVAQLSKLRNGQLLLAHYPYDEDIQSAATNNEVAKIFMMRDPRDVALSRYNYISRLPNHRFYKAFSSVRHTDEGIEIAIQGDQDSGLLPMKQVLKEYLPWIATSETFKFEDLVGYHGGGSANKQLDSITRLITAIGGTSKQPEIESIARRLYSEVSPTFFKSQIGKWQSEFSDSNKALAQRELGSYIELMGYQT